MQQQPLFLRVRFRGGSEQIINLHSVRGFSEAEDKDGPIVHIEMNSGDDLEVEWPIFDMIASLPFVIH